MSVIKARCNNLQSSHAGTSNSVSAARAAYVHPGPLLTLATPCLLVAVALLSHAQQLSCNANSNRHRTFSLQCA